MDEVFFVVQSPIFWFTTVFVGLLLSVFGAAIYDWLKIQVGKFSSKQRKRNEAEKERIEQEARKCAKSVKLIVLRRGFVADFFRVSDTHIAAALIVLTLALVIAVTPLLVALAPFARDILESEAKLPDMGIATDLVMRSMLFSLTYGWQPLRVWRITYIVALGLTILGYYYAYRSTKYARYGRYWQRVLNRAGKLIEEDLENETPDTDA